MAQKWTLGTDLSEQDYMALERLARDSGMTIDAMAAELIRDGLKVARVQRPEPVILPFKQQR